MTITGFLATTGDGIVMAVRNPAGQWVVDHLLAGHDVRCLATDRHRQGVIHAGTYGHGVLRSPDGGRTWEPGGLDGLDVSALAVSSVQAGCVFAGTRPALLFGSDDNGVTWQEFPGFRRIPHRRFWFSPAEKPFTAYVQAIAPSTVDPAIVIVGIEAGATVRTFDGGVTWGGHLRGALRDCHSLAAHVSESWFYEAGGTGAGVACSRDGGATWDQPRPGLDRHYGWACAADPADPAHWYVSVSPGPFKAHSDGNAQAFIYRMEEGAWQRLAGGLPQPLDHMPYGLLTDPDAPGAVYAGLANGDIWHSADHGASWERLPLRLGAIRRVLIGLHGD